MKKILALNGSHRGERGLTQTLLAEMQKGAEEAGGSFEIVVLARQKINRCLGCEACHTEASYLRCVYEDKDDVKAIQNKMAAADIIVYGTPIYVFNVSGLLKCFLDRINSTGDTSKLQVSKKGLFFHHVDKAVCSKPFVLLTTCGNIEEATSRTVVTYFTVLSQFMDAPMVGRLIRTSAFLLHNKTEEELPVKTGVLAAFRQAGRELTSAGRIEGKTEKQAARSVIAMPLAVRLAMKVKPLRRKLVEAGLKKGLIHFK